MSTIAACSHRHSRLEFRAVLLPLYAHVSRPLDRSALSLSCCPKIGSRRSSDGVACEPCAQVQLCLFLETASRLISQPLNAHTMGLRRACLTWSIVSLKKWNCS
jgi:hypothetical protein